jgi:chromosome segregation ATPase
MTKPRSSGDRILANAQEAAENAKKLSDKLTASPSAPNRPDPNKERQRLANSLASLRRERQESSDRLKKVGSSETQISDTLRALDSAIDETQRKLEALDHPKPKSSASSGIKGWLKRLFGK